jgi:cell division ATPase FtsA
MEMLQANEEGRWLWSLERDQRTLFLALLAHELTVVGRNSYQVQTEELDQPRQLRRTNEILHRVTACLREALIGAESGGFVESIGVRVLEPGDEELKGLTNWAWQTVKHRVLVGAPADGAPTSV